MSRKITARGKAVTAKLTAEQAEAVITPALRLNRRWLIVLVVALLLPWAVIAYLAARSRTTETSDGARHPVVNAGEAPRPNPGPWGDLRYTRILLRPPPEQLQELSYVDKASTWYFPDTTLDQLKALGEKVALTPEQTKLFLDQAKPAPQINGFEERPAPQLTLSLSPTSREELYCTLAGQTVNVDQTNAFRTPAELFPQWLGPQISPATRDLFQRLSYHRGDYYFFADLPLILPKVASQEEKVTLLKQLTQEPSLLIRLHVDASSNLADLTAYWGGYGRQRDVRPILEASARVPGGEDVDIALLLPPFARTRLYTYAEPAPGGGTTAGDCHWTALNFFNEIPDPSLHEKAKLEAVLRNYYPVYANPLFGDIVQLYRSQTEIIHSAIYIADDIVFSKNGSRLSSPYLLMPLQQLKDYYESDPPVKVVILRRKPVGER